MKTKIWTSFTSVILFALFATIISNAIQAQTIRIIVPSGQFEYTQSVFQPLADRLASNDSIYLELIPVNPGLDNLVTVTTDKIQEGSGPVIWLTGPASTEFYNQHTDFFQPEGLIPLGAGWHHGRADANITLSLPRRISTLPIITLAKIASPNNGEYDDMVQAFTNELFNSEEGIRSLRSLTVLPYVPVSGGEEVAIMFQPEREDNCGCDDRFANIAMCDSDLQSSILSRSMFGLERIGNRVVLQGYGIGNNNCDPCEDYRNIGNDLLLETVFERLNAGRDQEELMEHLNALEVIHQGGGIVAMCDPD